MTYNQIIQKAGKKVKKHVYYINDGVTTNVSDESVERIKFDTQTPLIGTSINGCEITLKEPINGEIYVQVDATYGNETKSETFGPYNLKEEPTYDANKKTYLHKCYDNLLKSMVDYQAITISYPCTIYQFFSQLTTEIGYTNNILSLPNGNIQMASDIYTGINYTYRDVLDDIAIANGVLFYIDGNEIKVATLGGDTITIDDDILKNKNIEFGEHYGPINSIVLSRGAGSDNVYIKDDESIEEYGLHEFKISDNQLMNDNNRDAFLPKLLEQLGGIEYDIYDTELTGYGKVRPLQGVNFETGNNTYSSYIFNNEIILTTGYKQAIYNDPPKQTETDYKSADTTDRRINQAYIIVNKQNQTIEQVTQTTEELKVQVNGVFEYVITEDITYKENKIYYELVDDEYQQLEAGVDYQIGDPIPENSVYEYKSVGGAINNLDKKIDENYNEIINEFGKYAPNSELQSLTNRVEQLQTDTYTKTQIQQIADGVGVDGVRVTAVISTEATFDKDGMLYEKTNAPTKTRINQAGLEVDSTETQNELLYAGYDDSTGQSIVRTDNLTVKTYAVVGTHGRFEEYIDDDNNEGVGFFIV